MSINTIAKACRDALQQGIYAVINPFVRLLIRLGVTPNMVTTLGMLGTMAGAGVIIYAGYMAPRGGDVFALLTLGSALIIGFSIFDMLDGQVARLGNMASAFGAMYDSVLDRYCELFTLGGIAFYLLQINHLSGALITFLALVGSLMVSYVRARAEGLDIECKIGFMQRPERVVVTFVGLIATGVAGLSAVDFDANIILEGAMLVIAIFANITAFARINHCRKAFDKRK